MENIKILDCTLRDGGRVINGAFSASQISDILSGLGNAGIDIVETGFLRTGSEGQNSTYFNSVSQISEYIKRDKNTIYSAFINYGEFDFSTLEAYDGSSVDAIRVGFKKHNFLHSFDKIVEDCKLVKRLGYKLFIQGINCLAYSEDEFLRIIESVNEINPYAFAIVDTYGGMYADDLRHIFNLADKNLRKDIIIDFHSHNNLQLSFALAQLFIELIEKSGRQGIVDSTLNGMGKCAGNLNTELIVDYMNRKKDCNYNFEQILTLIDNNISSIAKNHFWGYQTSNFIGGIYLAHPNNITHLSEIEKLPSSLINRVLKDLSPEKRVQSDYYKSK